MRDVALALPEMRSGAWARQINRWKETRPFRIATAVFPQVEDNASTLARNSWRRRPWARKRRDRRKSRIQIADIAGKMFDFFEPQFIFPFASLLGDSSGFGFASEWRSAF